ncbi:unnamed protein product [Caenorhabditis brenneri]
MEVQPKFPLLKLPMLAYRNVLQTMGHPGKPARDMYDLNGLYPKNYSNSRITTSLCSKKLRRIVKTSLTRSRSATLQIRPLWIRITTSEQYDGDIAFELEDVRNILSSKCTANDGRGYTWEIPTLTVKDWFKHLLDVTNCNSINVQLKGSGMNIQDLYALTQGLRIEKVEAVNVWLQEAPWLYEALIIFYPAKSQQLEYNFQDRRLFQSVVSRGYDTIDLEFRTIGYDIVRQDGVLAIVAEEIKVNDDRRFDGTLLTLMIWS